MMKKEKEIMSFFKLSERISILDIPNRLIDSVDSLIEKNILTIQVPSYFFYEWLEENYITLLRKVVKKQLGSEGSLEYSIVMENNNKSTNPYTVKIPAHSSNSLKNSPVNVPISGNEKQIRNPFVIPGLK